MAIRFVIFSFVFVLVIRQSFLFKLPKLAKDDTADNVNLKIVNGQYADRLDFPYQAFVLSTVFGNLANLCGGVIANERFIISAAHCVFNLTGNNEIAHPSTVEVSVGLDRLDNRSKKNTYPVKKIYVNQAYNDLTQEGDISIIELEQDLEWRDNVKKACFDLTYDSHLFYLGSGYGTVSSFTVNPKTGFISKPPRQGNELKYAIFKEIRDFKESCKNRFVCIDAFFSNSKDSICLGDSGGPLTTDEGNVIGVASLVFIDEKEDDLLEVCVGVAAYTRLAHNLAFIDSIIGPNEYCSIRE